MTGTTIAGAYVTGLTLSNAADNPVSILGSAGITNTAGPAVMADAANVWTIDTSGTILANGSASGYGIYLAGSGEVINEAGGRIAGYDGGLLIIATGAVSNQGSIAATGTAGHGVILGAGGGLDNVAGGTVTGGYDGVLAAGSIASTITNEGFVYGSAHAGIDLINTGAISNAASGTVGSDDFGLRLRAGGTVANAGSIGAAQFGIFSTGIATISNQGVIVAADSIGAGIYMRAGGYVSNAAIGTIDGPKYGMFVATAASTIQNLGVISAIGAAGGAVVLQAGGFVSNANTGTITGLGYGVLVTNTAATVINLGSIASASVPSVHSISSAGVQLRAGGVVTNGVSAVISAEFIGVQIGAGFPGYSVAAPGGTVVNQGTIHANYGTSVGAAIWVKGAGVIVNQATGTISGGPFAIVAYNQMTLTNFGVISGSDFAVDATSGSAVRVITEPGAVFSGVVTGGNTLGSSIASTLELAAGSGIGTLTGFGSKYIDFAQVTLDAGASWSFAGTVAVAQTLDFAGTGAELTLANPGSMAGTIAGFAAGDTLVLAGITNVTAATLGAHNLLTVSQSGGPGLTLQFDPSQTFTGPDFTFSASGQNTNLTAPCFVSGTSIETPAGLIPVEALRPGMAVRSHFGGTAEIVWVGHRRIDCRHHKRPHDVWPVRVRAGAFAPGQPARDLRLSPDHAVHVDGVLIPVRYLINGSSIVQEWVATVTYYHVELPAHDVVLAEGLPCESYLDTGNRGAFANGTAPTMLHADFAPRIWAARACAELVLAGPRLAAARRALLAQAVSLGHDTTDDPDFRVMVGNHIAGDCHSQAVRTTGPVRLLSRTWIPAHMRPRENDTRQLGVAIAALLIDGEALPLTDPRLASGWHAVEQGAWRWTDGDAVLDLDGIHALQITLAMTGTYWRRQPTPAATSPDRTSVRVR